MRLQIRRQRGLLLTLFCMSWLLVGSVWAQGGHHGGDSHTWPDSLEMITVSGTVIIDSSLAHPLYFLDEDGDEDADYHMSFGPWWYEPKSGANRPEAGELVEITGAVQDHAGTLDVETLLVFEINGETWRVSVEYGHMGWNAEPFWGEQADTLTASGIVFVDTTYFYEHAYLDTDGDTIPEYQLGFGPPWYEPASGATRPSDGDAVTVFGVTHERVGLDLLTVYELDGLEWRPFDEPAPWAGGWMRGNRVDSTRLFCANNPESWIDFPPGNMGHGMGMHAWPDSVFVQFWEIHSDSLPGMFSDRFFSGFHVNAHDRDRTRMMDGRFGGHGGQMRFEEEHTVRLRYYDDDLIERGLSDAGITVWAWDAEQSAWAEVPGANIDETGNSVTFTSSDLAGYYALEGTGAATSVDETSQLPERITLLQNYPNPFNPRTTIPYALASMQRVHLEVFDVLGRRVKVLVDEVKAAGEYQAIFDGQGLPSGVYIYQLSGSSMSLKRALILMK